MKAIHNWVLTTPDYGTPIVKLVADALDQLGVSHGDWCCEATPQPIRKVEQETITKKEIVEPIQQVLGMMSNRIIVQEDRIKTLEETIKALSDKLDKFTSYQ